MTDYALTVSEVEVRRYRFMAERARAEEAETWHRAGIGPGAVVADVGCGPAAVSVLIAKLVGPAGRGLGVEPDNSPRPPPRQPITQGGGGDARPRPGAPPPTG